MGYYADGGGVLELKPNIDVDELESKLDASSGGLSYSISDKEIEFWCEDKYYEDSVYDDLEAVKPYIVAGNLDFIGEDKTIWRIRFDPDKQEWIEESGTIDYNFESYTDEEMIQELIKRGYIVQKKPQND